MTWKKSVLVIAAAIAAWLLSCPYIVDASQSAVVLQFGRAAAVRTQPGLYFKLPWPLQTVVRFDARARTYETPLVEFLTQDKKNVLIQSFLCWRIEDPLLFYRSVRTAESLEPRLEDNLFSLVGAHLGNYGMDELVSTTPDRVRLPEMEQALLKDLRARVAETYGVEAVWFGVSRLALPEENARSVYERMRKEREAIADQYRAMGREEADKIRAEADKQRREILSEAQREATIVKGEADARAVEITAEAYAEAPELYTTLKSLEAYRELIGNNATMVLSADDPLFDVLRETPFKVGP